MNNSLAEWSDKNLPLTPDRITYGSNKVVWWKGACGHEWQTSVKARSNGENCPICSGARVIEGINDLATLKPELADEWSSKNDPLKPTMVTTGSHKKVIWQDIAEKELIEYKGDVYVVCKKRKGEASYNSCVDCVRNEGNGKFTVVIAVKMPPNGNKRYVDLPTEKNAAGEFVFTDYPYWDKSE